MENFAVPVAVPSGKTEFTLPDGRRFALDLVEASIELDKIYREHKDIQNGDDLRAVGEWIKQRTGTDLNLAQIDWFWQFVVAERYRAKQVFQRELQSLSSTDAIPPNGANENSLASGPTSHDLKPSV